MFLFSLMQAKGSAVGVERGRAVAMRAGEMFAVVEHFFFHYDWFYLEASIT
jgi:hypothetical protein